MPRVVAVAALAGLLLTALGFGGYLVGESNGPTGADADRVHSAAFTRARQAAYEAALRTGQERGDRDGVHEGHERGRRTGTRAGKTEARNELAVIRAEQAEAANTPAGSISDVPHAGAPESSSCPPADQLCLKLEAGVLPTGPNPDCPPGQVPAGVTGACAPRE